LTKSLLLNSLLKMYFSRLMRTCMTL